MTFVLPKRYSARATPAKMDFENSLGRSQGLCQVRKGLVPSDASHPVRSSYGDACRLEDILTMLLLDGLATGEILSEFRFYRNVKYLHRSTQYTETSDLNRKNKRKKEYYKEISFQQKEQENF
jgi:hypothetical protein